MITNETKNSKIHLSQADSIIGDFSKNAEIALEEISFAISQNKSIIVFPELFLCGYPPEDLLLSQRFISSCEKAQNKFVDELKAEKYDGITVIFGNVASSKPYLKSGEISSRTRIAINCAFLVECAKSQTKQTLVKIKSDLPNYGVFDEARYFEPSSNLNFEPKIINGISVSICEDIWNPPFEIPHNDEVWLSVVLNASPYRHGKQARRVEAVKRIATKYGVSVAYCNALGATDDLVFDGNSFLMNEKGEIVEKQIGILDDDHITTDFYAIVLGLKKYCEKNGFKTCVVGLSGGIDSALTAYIAACAIGKENVFGIMMPSKYSSSGSIIDAQTLAENLGIQTFTFPILDEFSTFTTSFKQAFQEESLDLTEQNVQARIRGQILMAFSNQQSEKGEGACLVLATGNKSEIAVGYSTIYGDAVGGFAPLKDVYKTDVYKMAKYINAKNGEESSSIIPENTLTKPPSAELKPGQKDQDTLPDYEILDDILRALIEGYYDIDKVIDKYGKDLVLKVAAMVRNSQWKRKQYPLGPKLSAVEFGKDWRMPITHNYNVL